MTADTGADDEDDAHSDAPEPEQGEGREQEPDEEREQDPKRERTRADQSVDHADVVAIAEAVDALGDDVDDLDEDLAAIEERLEEKTVHRDEIRAELRRYVRKRQRRGHATGWGPYLVLLYGTVMTVAAFYYLGDLWAMFAMFVIWLSTLGLYVFMLVLGAFLGVGRRVAGLRDLAGKFR